MNALLHSVAAMAATRHNASTPKREARRWASETGRRPKSRPSQPRDVRRRLVASSVAAVTGVTRRASFEYASRNTASCSPVISPRATAPRAWMIGSRTVCGRS